MARTPARTIASSSASSTSTTGAFYSVCAYYRSNGNLLDQVDVFRLCYAGSRLAAKDVLPG